MHGSICILHHTLRIGLRHTHFLRTSKKTAPSANVNFLRASPVNRTNENQSKSLSRGSPSIVVSPPSKRASFCLDPSFHSSLSSFLFLEKGTLISLSPSFHISRKMIRSSLTATTKLAQRVASRQNGAIRMMGGKEILFGVEGRAAMLRGVDMLADAVQVSFLTHVLSVTCLEELVIILKDTSQSLQFSEIPRFWKLLAKNGRFEFMSKPCSFFQCPVILFCRLL